MIDWINTVVMDFPNNIPSYIVLNDDSSYTIFLNARMNKERQMIAYWHEIRHIMGDDFYSGDSVDYIESVNEH